jgi:peroxiredoxin
MTPVRKNMFARTRSTAPAWLVAVACGALACKPEPTTRPPPDPQPVTTPPPATDPAPETAPATDPATTPTTPPLATGGDPPATTPPVAAADPPADTVMPPPKPGPAGKEPLPAALNTKINATCGKDPGVGTPAKQFTLKTPEGKDISLASFKGKVVLLNFWGTWCKPCLKELPEFDRLYRRYRKHGLVVVAIATDTEPEKVKEFAAQAKLATKLAIGGEELSQQYDSPNFPFSFVIDGKGEIQASYRGYRPECAGKLEQDVRSQLELLR